MKITDPKAKYGDKVMVLNYRKNPPKWEEGEVRTVSYKDNFGNGFTWSYDIFIDRGKKFFLYVGNSHIKRIDL